MSEPAPVPADQEEALRGQKRAVRANARADRAEGRVRLLLSRAMGAEEARDNARRHCGYLQAQVDQLASELREAREARDRLREAILPFVEHRAWARRNIWPIDIAEDPSTPILGQPADEGAVLGEINVGHFDAAAAAYAGDWDANPDDPRPSPAKGDDHGA